MTEYQLRVGKEIKDSIKEKTKLLAETEYAKLEADKLQQGDGSIYLHGNLQNIGFYLPYSDLQKLLKNQVESINNQIKKLESDFKSL